MLQALTFILFALSLFHLWLQGYNRHYLCITDGPLKTPINIAWFISTMLPGILVLAFYHWKPVYQALSWQPESLLSRLLFSAMAALILFMAVRFGAWLIWRLVPERPAALREEKVSEAPVAPVPPLLPRGFRRFETTSDLQFVEREIVVPGLAPVFDGLTIAHVADLHFGERLEMENYFNSVREFVNSLDADFVVFTGDFADRRRDLVRSAEFHAKFRARIDLLCVLGNHDYWLRPDRLIRSLEDTPIRNLGHNARKVYKRAGRRLVFAGTDYPWHPDEPNWERLLWREMGDAVILLSHTPDNAQTAARHGVSLVLSGHNHGGQFRLPVVGPIVVPSKYGLRYTAGLFTVGRGTLLNVSKGVGVSSGKLRVLCPPEINLLTLRAPFADVAVPAEEGKTARIVSPREVNGAATSSLLIGGRPTGTETR